MTNPVPILEVQLYLPDEQRLKPCGAVSTPVRVADAILLHGSSVSY